MFLCLLLSFKLSYSQNQFLLLESNNLKNMDRTRVFAPNTLSTDLNDCKVTINSKGDELVFQLQVHPTNFQFLCR